MLHILVVHTHIGSLDQEGVQGREEDVQLSAVTSPALSYSGLKLQAPLLNFLLGQGREHRLLGIRD